MEKQTKAPGVQDYQNHYPQVRCRDGGGNMKKVTRRNFLKTGLKVGAGAVLLGSGCTNKQDGNTKTTSEPAQAPPKPVVKESPSYLSAVRGKDPAEITKLAVRAVGGIERFVKDGDDVIIKPNICADYHSYEYASTTNPVVVATLVSLCLESGAKRVRVMDNTVLGNPAVAHEKSGIKSVVEEAGGKMEIMSPLKFRDTAIPGGVDIKSWPVYQEIMKTDVLINVPVLKDHPATHLTAGCKNFMGVIKDPIIFHNNLAQRIADLVSLIRPALTVVDAVRILMHNGPTGGSLADVKKMDTVIASHDMIAADSYAFTLFNVKGEDIKHIKIANQMGLGTMNLEGMKIKKITL